MNNTFTTDENITNPHWYFYWHPRNYKQPWYKRMQNPLCWNWYISKKWYNKLIINIRTPWFEFGKGL